MFYSQIKLHTVAVDHKDSDSGDGKGASLYLSLKPKFKTLV